MCLCPDMTGKVNTCARLSSHDMQAANFFEQVHDLETVAAKCQGIKVAVMHGQLSKAGAGRALPP